MLQAKTTAKNQTWTIDLRARVGDAVSYQNKTWSNRTGINSEPTISSNDWEVVFAEADPEFTIFGNRFELRKNPNNTGDASTLEVNDIAVNGFRDSATFWNSAIFLGGVKDTDEAWKVLSRIKEIPNI